MPLSEKIKTCRQELQYTQQEVAEILGVSKRSVAYYESGQRCPSLEHIAKIARLFHVSVVYLIYDANTDRGAGFLEESYRRELFCGTMK